MSLVILESFWGAKVSFDLDTWLAPIDGENPSGVSLRNDNRYSELERLAEPQIEIVRDANNNPVSKTAAPIDWGTVLDKATELAAEGHDLRLLALVARGFAGQEGLAGAAQGLELIVSALDRFWDSIHPQLREGKPPKEAAIRRLNAIRQIENDENGLLGDLERMPLLSPRGIGPLQGADLAQSVLSDNEILSESASGMNDTEKAALVERHQALVSRVKSGCRAVADQDAEAFAALKADAAAALKAASDIEAKVTEKLGEFGIALGDLTKFLTRINTCLGGVNTDDSNAEETSGDQVTNVTATAAADSAPSPQSQGGRTIPDRLNSRADVQRCLELVIEFYQRTEPSSPIPLLAERLNRMVPMDFMELMQELAPSGLKEFKSVAGKDGK